MDKLRPLRDAIALDVEDGMSLAMGCGLESLIPFAVSHEIIRQKRQDLTLICPISDMQFDQLIGAGCVKKIIASWVGNVAAGLWGSPSYRREQFKEVNFARTINSNPFAAHSLTKSLSQFARSSLT